MDNAKSQTEGPSGRRSMLPQKKSSFKSFSKPMNSSFSKHEHECHESVGHCATLAPLAVSQASQQRPVTMMPPHKLRSPPHKSDSAKSAHMASEPSASRKSSQDRSAKGGYFRKGSGGSESQSKIPESYHGRSLSQQMRLTATADPLRSKAPHQRQSSIKNPRPAFSGMQQHYALKKGTQADHPITSPSPIMDKDAIPSADIFHSQMELAQLHLLHRSALHVQVQWEKSARRSFEHQFNALHERHTELKEVAHQQQALVDQLSLVQWSQSRPGAQIAEKVQLLSRSILDICNLLDSEGRYTCILETFESWLTQALKSRDQLDSVGENSGKHPNVIEDIGDGWKAEAMVLERELTYSGHDIKSFGEVLSTSSLCRILSVYRRLVAGLLEELDLIQWIEHEIKSQETSWIESAGHKLTPNGSEDIDLIGPDRNLLIIQSKDSIRA